MSDNQDFLRRYRQTRIVATLGPASASREMIADLYHNGGVDVFRLNFSHGDHADHADRIRIIRELEQETGRPIGVFADLQGPKIRVGTFKDGPVTLTKGHVMRFDLDKTPGDATRVCLPHPDVIEALEVGAHLLIDDGKVKMRVIKKGKDFVEAECVAGKKISDRKGVNLPDVILQTSPLTPKDLKDLEAAVGMGVDWIALSFVQRPEDVAEARKVLNKRAQLIVKLEKPSALQYLQELVDMSDAVMLARGDLGVEIPAEEVPSVQKRVVRVARDAGKPVIIATQMLESMVTSPTPTRAEASDVATAIYDGADAIMLSAETAAGDYPVEAAEMMRKIARFVEQDPLYRKIMDAEHPDPEETSSDAITASACRIAASIGAAAIVNYTTSGSTALRTARERPAVPIICLTEYLDVARRMSLSYGVHAVHTEDVDNFSDMVEKAIRMAKEQGIAEDGQRLVITAGVPFGTPGSTNILRIAWVK